MSRLQETNEVNYKSALKLLKILLNRGFITCEEYEQIDALNRETFSPELAKVYA